MPWRRKPARFLSYWSGPVKRNEGFKTVLVYCVGAQGYRCHHHGRLRLDDLPDWDWYDISAHLKCTECGAVGWVCTRPDWTEVINFSKGIFPRSHGKPGSAQAIENCGGA
jgi:hypothetical protein